MTADHVTIHGLRLAYSRFFLTGFGNPTTLLTRAMNFIEAQNAKLSEEMRVNRELRAELNRLRCAVLMTIDFPPVYQATPPDQPEEQ